MPKRKLKTKKQKTLVIVESPTKARTIGRFLDNKFQVESSYGHIRDLPSSSLGIDTENNFEPHYIIPRKKSKAVKALKEAVKKSNSIVLATDEDREGEAIAWHLIYALGLDEDSIKKAALKKSAKKPPRELKIERIVFHEITKPAIEEALKNPRPIDINLVDAQQARRMLDRLVGYKLSPFLWKKVMRRLSAGRVQSVALRLIVERERERIAFKNQEFWTIEASLKKQGKDNEFNAILNSWEGKKLEKFDIPADKDAKRILKELEGQTFTVGSIAKKAQEKSPSPPFTTSTLQQEASRRLGYSAKQTMLIAQQLYEGIELKESSAGLITYMRTDSVSVSEASLANAKLYIEEAYGKNYAQEAPRRYKTKSKGAQEAHEAIRPTDAARTPASIKEFLDNRQYRLYALIWQRFVASQMSNAVFDTTSFEINAGRGVFKTTGQIIKFDGFLKVWPSKVSETELPGVSEGEKLDLEQLSPIQHFTEPPARYSDASLVKTLEKFGIGRPSTYAPTMSTITDRGYVLKDEQKRFYPSDIGYVVNDMLTEHFPKIVDIQFTAKMEEDLDKIAEGAINWQPVIKEFYEPFARHLEEKYETVEKKDMTEPTGEDCEKCGKPMIIRHGRFGKFIACSGFPDCRNTKKLPPKLLNIPCAECGEGMLVERRTKKRRIFYGCSRYPDCKYATWKLPKKDAEDALQKESE